MDTSFSAHIETVQTRWWQALEAAGYDAAVIAAGDEQMYYQDDQPAPYRPNLDFAQFLPGEPAVGAMAVVRPGEQTRIVMVIAEDYWHAPPQPPLWAEEGVELEIVSTDEAAVRAVRRALEGSSRALLMAQEADSNLGCAGHNDERVSAPVHFARATKTGYELERMRAASLVGVRGHLAARECFYSGGSEFDIHMAYLTASQQTAESLPYANIIALNEHAAVLHYHHYERTSPQERHSFLIDAGGQSAGYKSDITRTYAAADGPFADLVAAMDERQQRLTRAVLPGCAFVDLHRQTHQDVADLLAEFGLVTCSPEAALALGLTQTFLPHGLGHLIGLQTHDIAGQQAAPTGGSQPPPEEYPALRLTRTLEVDQVLTIEPGLYFIPMLLNKLRQQPEGRDVNWTAVEALLPCGGIRIEDNVRVDHEPENLTRQAFAEADR